MGSAPRIRKSAQDRKAEIVQTAIRLAAELGPDRVTTQRLADEVGLTQPAIFRHFPTKADIWVSVGQFIVGRFAAQPDNDPEAPSEPLAHLRATISRHLSSLSRHPAITAILFSRELHVENEELRAHFEKMMAARRAGFARLIEQARDAGRLRAGIVPEDGAALVLATIQGLAMRWSLEKRRFDLQAEGERLIFGLLDNWAA